MNSLFITYCGEDVLQSSGSSARMKTTFFLKNSVFGHYFFKKEDNDLWSNFS